MKKILSVVMILMLALGLMVPVFGSAASAKSVEGHEYMWVNTENGKTLNVRETPSTRARVLYKVECGTRLNVVEDYNGEWACVYQTGKRVGYVMTKFLVYTQPGKYEITEREDNFRTVTPYKVTAVARGRNTNESVGLRVIPNKTSRMIRRLMAGDTLEVIAIRKLWNRVRDLQTGKIGYVANDYIVRK